MIFFATGVELFLSLSVVKGQTLPLVKPITNVILVHSSTSVPAGVEPSYAVSGLEADWNLAQWGIPTGDLPPFTVIKESGERTTISQKSDAAIIVDGVSPDVSVTLSQNGRDLTCSDSHGQPLEFDMFLAPNDRLYGGSTKLGLAGNPPSQPTLSQIKKLIFSARVSLLQKVDSDIVACNDNSGSAIIALILNNFDHTTPLTLFYQLSINAFCERDIRGYYVFCGNRLRPMSFFSAHNPYGVDDFLPWLGKAWMNDGDSETLSIDMLPRLQAVLSNLPLDIDRNPSHWRFHTLYIGQHIWGKITMTTSWRQVRLEATLN